MRLVVATMVLILIALPYSMAIDLGSLEWKDGKLFGKYVPSGIEGKISCYVDNKNIMDIIYRNDSIELDIKYFDALEKIVERNPFLKDELENSLIPLNIRGSSFRIDYGGCIVELHDVPTRFLRVKADKIVVSGINYDVNVENNYSLFLTNENFSAILMSEKCINYDGNSITACGDLMLASFTKEEKRIEGSVMNRTLGGELTIIDYDTNKTDFISYFGNVTIHPEKISKDGIVLNVNGDSKSGGKIIKINLGHRVASGRFRIKLDDVPVKKASGFDDIMNPDDDGIAPEYYNISTEEGEIILITIPHFSDHQLSIEFIRENVMATFAAIAMGILFIFLAAFYMFKK